MLTLKAEYIAMLVFADICAFICTMCVLWLALRLSTILSLKTHLTAGDRGGSQPARAARNGRRNGEQSWDEEQFGFSTQAEPVAAGASRGRAPSRRRGVEAENDEQDDAAPAPEDREQDWYSADDVDVIVARAREDQKKEDAVNFARNTRQQPGGARPSRAARGAG